MDIMDCYHNLANAIIITAANDWRKAVQTLKKYPSNTSAQKEKALCEEFFLSEYFDILTNVYGDDLLRRLKEEAGID